MSGTVETSTRTEDQLFVRNATGLVRNVSPLTSTIINYIPGAPVQVVGAGLFWALSTFPGGNFYLALLLVVPMMLSFSYAFGLMTAAIPRSGGDYMIVSRVVHPAIGLISSFFMTLAGLLGNAFYGLAFVTIAIGPGLVAWGVIDGHQGLVDAGNTLITSKGWQFGLGSVVILGAAITLAGGWGWTRRIQTTLFSICMGGLVIAALIALFRSRGGFESDFNSFAQPLTGKGGAYQSVIGAAEKAGVDTDPGFSFSKTIPLLGVLAGFSIYSYWSTFVGGELRQASSIGTASRMAIAGLLNLVGIAVCVLIFFKTFGSGWLAAAFGGGMPEQISLQPFYFSLVGIITNSGILAFILALSFAAFWPLLCYIAFLQPTRMIFAYAFDGLLPQSVTRVSSSGSPYVAVGITTVLSILFLAWAVFLTDKFFQVLVYAVLVQLIAMALVGLSALLFPILRPELYAASSAQKKLLGVPVVQIAGAGSIITAVFLWILYFHYAGLGLTDKGSFWLWAGGAFVLAIVYYAVVRAVNAQRGVDLNLVYAEIPPE